MGNYEPPDSCVQLLGAVTGVFANGKVTQLHQFFRGAAFIGWKSFVACALAQKACSDGYSAPYTRAQTLFRDLAMARADGRLRSLLARLSRIDVLMIDDWAMAPLPGRHVFYVCLLQLSRAWTS
jgi:DNA replication protein DnaC